MYFSLNFGWYSIVLDDNVCYKNSLWRVEEVGGWWGEVGGLNTNRKKNLGRENSEHAAPLPSCGKISKNQIPPL